MRIHILQHTEETPVGSTQEWLAARGLDSTTTRLFKNERLPDPSGIDWLVVCGGGMGVHDEAEFPWIKDEKRFIRETLAGGSGVLGLCLGAQLIADVSGAKVGRHAHWEVGWFPVEFESGERLLVFQYHQDAFEIPAGARRLARGTSCINQGFALGDRVVGFQFHPEATAQWVKDCAEERDYPAGPFVQPREEITRTLADRLTSQREWYFRFLDEMRARI